jgi:hypothetical protein
MNTKHRVLLRWARHGGIAQFHRPAGAAGWVMGRRSSNVVRNHWAAGLLDVRPDGRGLEPGCGPGVAVAALTA